MARTLTLSLPVAAVWAAMPSGLEETAPKAAPAEVLKAEGRGIGGSRGRVRAQQLLVATEIAMSMLLLAGAGLLLRSYLRLQRVDPGFRPDHVLSLQLMAPKGRFIELGRLGIWSAEQVAASRPDVAYHVLDLPEVAAREPERAGMWLRELIDMFGAEQLRPLPVQTF